MGVAPVAGARCGAVPAGPRCAPPPWRGARPWQRSAAAAAAPAAAADVAPFGCHPVAKASAALRLPEHVTGCVCAEEERAPWRRPAARPHTLPPRGQSGARAGREGGARLSPSVPSALVPRFPQPLGLLAAFLPRRRASLTAFPPSVKLQRWESYHFPLVVAGDGGVGACGTSLVLGVAGARLRQA